MAEVGERIAALVPACHQAGGLEVPQPPVKDPLVIEAVDALHETATIDDGLWARLASAFSDAQLLDLLLLCGWYHAISFAANAVRVEPEDGAPRFADMLG